MPGTRTKPIPPPYLITFTCYGARLHGDESGSVDRSHNVYGTPLLASNPSRVSSEERRTKQTPYCLDGSRRAIVLAAVVELCAHREWRLLAAHIRTQHVHMVIAAEDAPEKVLEDAEKYASRALHRAGTEDGTRRRWTRHGSTRYLWRPENVGSAIHYVVREQGEPMAIWEDRNAFG